MAKKVKGSWKKEGGSRVPFLDFTKFPNDIQGFVKTITEVPAKKKGWSPTTHAVIMKNDGNMVKIQGSKEGAFGAWINTKKEGSKVRILYTGGNKEGGDEIPKGLKDYEAFKKWKGKNGKFYPDYEFFGA